MARLEKRGGTYHVTWYERRDGKRVHHSLSTKCSRKSDAEIILEDFNRQEVARRFHIPLDWTVADLLPLFLESEKARQSPRWYQEQVKAWKCRLSPAFGASLLSEVTRGKVEAVFNRWAGELSPRTLNLHLVMLRKFFKWTVETGRAHTNPVADIKQFRQGHDTPHRVLTLDEYVALRAASSGHVYAFITLGCRAGLRSAEMRNLSGPDVDMASNQIIIQAGEEFRPKSRRYRIIPMHPEVRELFEGREAPEGPWFPSPKGGDVIGEFRRGLDGACTRAGIPRITPHGLRHTFGSWLIAGGANLNDVKLLLGHSSIVTTQIYLHSLPGGLAGAIGKLP